MCMFGTGVYFASVSRMEKNSVPFILFAWFLVLSVYLTVSYWRHKKSFSSLFSTHANIGENNLFVKIMKASIGLDEHLYFNCLYQEENPVIEKSNSTNKEDEISQALDEQLLSDVKRPLNLLRLKYKSDKYTVLDRVSFETNHIETHLG